MTKRKLKIDIDGIVISMEDIDREIAGNEHYLNLKTGEILIMPKEVFEAVENEEEDDIYLAEWEKELIPQAKDIFNNYDHYRIIPTVNSQEIYNLMVSFAGEIKDVDLREKLAIALNGKGAFRRFKDVLSQYPDYRDQWYQKHDEYLKAQALEWLDSLGIEPMDTPSIPPDISKEEIKAQTIKHASNMLENLMQAWEVRPKDMSAEEEKELLKIMEKAKKLNEGVIEALNKDTD